MKYRELLEACWKGYHKEGMKTMFGKRYPNCVKNKKTNENIEHFNGLDFSIEIEKDDEYVDDDDTDNQTIYVRAFANGRELGHVLFTIDYDSQGMVLKPQDLEVDERFQGQGVAATMYDYVKSKGYRIRRSGQQTDAGAGFWNKHRPDQNIWEQHIATMTEAELEEDLKKWFKEKWVRFGPDGKIRGECGGRSEGEGKPKCLPQSKAHALGKKGRKTAASRKRREDPNPERKGSAINVKTK